MTITRILISMLCAVVFYAAPGYSKVIQASKNGRAPYEPGLQVQLDGTCTTLGAEETYETVLDNVPCYRMPYSITMNLWSVSNYGPITSLTDSSCDPIVRDVTGPCRFSDLCIKQSGIYYKSNSVLCSKCQTECWQIDDSSTESYTFDIYQPCPKNVTVSYLEGSATADGNAVSDGQQFQASSTVATGPDGKIEVTFEDGSVVRLAPNSKITLGCDEKPDDGTTDFKFTLLLGKIWSKIPFRVDRQVNISTRRVVCGNRGTEYEVSDDDMVTRVLVAEGKVNVANIAGTDSIKLTKCSAAEVNSEGVITEIDPYSTENINCGGGAVLFGPPALMRFTVVKQTDYFTISGRRIVDIRRLVNGAGGVVIRRMLDSRGRAVVERVVPVF